MGGQVEEDFFKALGGSKADVQAAKPDEKDPELSEDALTNYKLWHIFEKTKKLRARRSLNALLH